MGGNAFVSFPSVSDAVGGWIELGRTTLESTSTSINVASLPNKRYYQVLINSAPDSGSIDQQLQLNADTATNYSRRFSIDGSDDGSQSTRTAALIQAGGGRTTQGFSVGYLANLSTKEKLMLNWYTEQNTAGAGNVPKRSETVSKWANTTDSIDEFTAITNSANSWAVGSELVILGWDPADIHTNNFWEELASTTLGSPSDDITADFTAKKYIWFQLAGIAVTGSVTCELRLGSSSLLDAGPNYAFRGSANGGADGTGINLTSLGTFNGDLVAGLPAFVNGFIINNAANEKLIIHTGIQSIVSGAGTAPARRENVGKWTETSNQADILGFVKKAGGGQLDTGTTLKVWGSN